MYSSTVYLTSAVDGAGWARGPVWTDAKNLAATGIRSPDSPVRSESLYRLSYTGPFLSYPSLSCRTVH